MGVLICALIPPRLFIPYTTRRTYQQQLEWLAAQVGPCLGPDLPTLLAAAPALRSLSLPSDLVDLAGTRKRRGGIMRACIDKGGADEGMTESPFFVHKAPGLPSPTVKRKRTAPVDLRARSLPSLGTTRAMLNRAGSGPMWVPGALTQSSLGSATPLSVPVRAQSLPSHCASCVAMFGSMLPSNVIQYP